MRRQVNRGNRSVDLTIPSPIMGLNVRDSLSAMQPMYAYRMDNYIPMENKVAIRPGYSYYVKLGETKSGVKTMVSYNKPGHNKMIALYDHGAYDVSTINSKKYEIIFNKSYCQTVQYKDHLFFMNGIDKPKVFYVDEMDVEHFEDWNFHGETSETATLPLLQEERIIAGAVSKEFLWFVEKGTLKAWYSAIAGNTQGNLKSFDLAQVVKKGGELVAISNWTIDGGMGIDDLTVFLTSEGEVLIYSGYNPNDANNWSLKGSYFLSKPIGYKCIMQYQGDLVIISEDGYIPLSKSLALSNSGQSTVAFSDIIRGLVLDRTMHNSKKEGWQGVVYSRGGYAIFNVPVNAQFEQHVVNTATGAWCRFTNIRSYCWCIYNNELYFGDDNTIYRYGNTYSDNGIQIEGWINQAYNNLGTDKLKKVQLLNPRTRSSTRYKLSIYTNMDFEDRNVNYYSNIGYAGGTKWNTSKWNIAEWGTNKATTVRSQWLANNSTGFNASIVFKTKTKGNNIEWYNTGIRYEVGNGIL